MKGEGGTVRAGVGDNMAMFLLWQDSRKDIDRQDAEFIEVGG